MSIFNLNNFNLNVFWQQKLFIRVNLFLRSLLLMLLMILITIFWSCVCLFFTPILSYTKRYYLTSRWNIYIIWAARIICGIHYQIRGLENLPDTPVIFLSKHQSIWETIFYMTAIPRPLAFVFKKELIYIPFFGWGISLLQMIPVDRKNNYNAFSQVLMHGRKCLANGQSIVIFPEGTRISVGKTGKYKHSGPRLAIETNTVIIPIAMNAGEHWPKKSFIKIPGMITVSIGQPIIPTGLNSKELSQHVENWIESEMKIISPWIYNKN